MLTIRKIDGGFIVINNGQEQIAHADHVSNLIIRWWPEVYEHIKEYVIHLESQKDGSN
jgi:hypothetical protein